MASEEGQYEESGLLPLLKETPLLQTNQEG